MDPKNQQGTQNTARDRTVGDPNDRSQVTGSAGSQKQPVGDREYDDIEKRFKVQPLIGDKLEVHKKIMFGTKDLAIQVIENTPNNRERALALTKLEEFGIWCEKALQHSSNF